MLAPLIELYDSLSPIIILAVSIGWWRSASRGKVADRQAGFTPSVMMDGRRAPSIAVARPRAEG